MTTPPGPPGRVLAVNVAAALEAAEHSDRPTGIGKRPSDGPVAVSRLGLLGDHVGDLRHHGGPDAAVYAYDRDDAAFWEGELSRTLPPGAFGENLTVDGVAASGAVLGETWEVGGAVLRVRGPRIPCRTFAGAWGVPDLVRRFAAARRPGAYLAVDREGPVAAGDRVVVRARPAHGVTVAELAAVLQGERGLAAHVLTAGADLPGRHWGTVQRAAGA